MSTELLQVIPPLPLHDSRRPGWDRAELEALMAELVHAAQVSEQGFLVLGREIRLLHDRAHGISRLAGEVLQLLQGDHGENTLHHLRRLVERCSLWLAASGEKSAALCTLLRDVEIQASDLAQPLSGLRKVIKTVHALRVSTRIEASKGYAVGSSVLAASLDELGKLVQEKVAGICARSEALMARIKTALAMEESVQSGALRIARHEVHNAHRLLTAFQANCLETGQSSDRLMERSENIRQSFAELVSALQFQDITRQRIEHVQKALAKLVHHLELLERRPDAGRDTGAARLLGRICRLQHDQLDLACREFLAAAAALTTNLHGMATHVVAMAADTRELSRAAGIGCESRFHSVLDRLRMIADCLYESRRIHQAAGTQLADVCHEIHAVTGLVGEIELIGEEMQLLAMNAAIGAGHAHQLGAGLDIIAQNIHAVAEEATGHALALAGVCAAITRHAGQLQDFTRETQAGAENVDSLLAEAQQHTAGIERNCSGIMVMAGDVQQAANSLAGDVGRVAKSIDVRTDFMSKLTPVLTRLDRLGSWSDPAQPVSPATDLDHLFDDLEHCYTMDSERRVHRQFSVKPLAGPQAKQGWLAHRQHNLGDNVDLF